MFGGESYLGMIQPCSAQVKQRADLDASITAIKQVGQLPLQLDRARVRPAGLSPMYLDLPGSQARHQDLLWNNTAGLYPCGYYMKTPREGHILRQPICLLFISGILECRFGEKLVGVETWKTEKLKN
jgi:hypothetical protein